MATDGPSVFLRRRRQKTMALILGLVLVAAAVVVAVTRSSTSSAADGRTRTYYIAADPVDWDYAPGGKNVLGEHFDADAGTFLDTGEHRIGHIDRKSVYREYTDGTFSILKPRPAEWEHLGVLGPPIHAVVGDTIKVVFKNNTPYPASMHAHGVFYDKASEGADYEDGTSGDDKADDAVPEGQQHTYTWQVPERAGPAEHDESSMLWSYHSHTDEIADTNAGLIGPLIVTRKGMARADGSPKDVEREVVANFDIYDENLSPWLDWNIEHHAGKPDSVDKKDADFVESNLKHSINGYLFGTLPGLDFKKGQHIRWYVMGAGTETGIHTPHWHGNTVVSMGQRMDMMDILPMTMKTADMVPDAPGQWMFHCHVNDHIAGGMSALFRVTP
ncbi:MAG: multicopper oxidase domain-containing protein [Actinobacteria bacterium]|nr:multicopper oxidase domain-containing protein [Actinomycetota bacterium]